MSKMTTERAYSTLISGNISEMFEDVGVNKNKYEMIIGYAIASAAHDKDQTLSFSKIKDYYDDARSYLRAQEED